MDAKKLVKHLIMESIDYKDPLPLIAVLPEDVDFDKAFVRLLNEEGTPAFEGALEKSVEFYSQIVENYFLNM